ncbi:unnamed protein product [Ambrosiozyma monospora]|uniref:Unnamed protein product n=1 Tax=Ambrosiozyma monospora TaxID=43982 RepID=A0ACB5T986_AMBMO|nr:unnamed protein product [Ambrosiozyma monospora]
MSSENPPIVVETHTEVQPQSKNLEAGQVVNEKDHEKDQTEPQPHVQESQENSSIVEAVQPQLENPEAAQVVSGKSQSQIQPQVQENQAPVTETTNVEQPLETDNNINNNNDTKKLPFILAMDNHEHQFRFLIITQLLFWAVLANLARIGLTALTNFTNAYVNYSLGTSLWCNFAACLVLATVIKSNKFWDTVLASKPASSSTAEASERVIDDKSQTSLFIGLTFGFCGSLCTFSSFIMELVLKTCDVILYQFSGDWLLFNNKGDGAMDFFSVLFIQFGVSIFGWLVGCDLAKLINWVVDKYPACTGSYLSWRIFELVTSFLGIAALIVNIVLSAAFSEYNSYKGNYSIAICFAPVAVVLRYYLITKLNGHKTWFPTGTFLCNLISCAIICPLIILMYGTWKDGWSPIVFNQAKIIVMSAILTGFCGTLDTMSYFIKELIDFKDRKKRWMYFWVTFLSCFGVVIVIIAAFFVPRDPNRHNYSVADYGDGDSWPYTDDGSWLYTDDGYDDPYMYTDDGYDDPYMYTDDGYDDPYMYTDDDSWMYTTEDDSSFTGLGNILTSDDTIIYPTTTYPTDYSDYYDDYYATTTTYNTQLSGF